MTQAEIEAGTSLAEGTKNENDGKKWSQSFTIFEDRRPRVESLVFDGESLIAE